MLYEKNIVLAGGCFDILHIGHIKFLKKAKSFGNYLIVLLEPNENIRKIKGQKRPIFNLSERKAVLESLKFVDEVVVVPKNANHKVYAKLVSRIKPSIIAITKGDPIKDKKLAQAKSIGAKLKVIKKYKSFSSTRIIKLFTY